MESNKRIVMKTTNFTIKKIPLEEFISILIELYDGGADFVDVTGKPNSEQDTIQISVLQEYMSPEADNITEQDFNDIIG